LQGGQWQGFACTLTAEDIARASGVLAGLQRSAAQCTNIIQAVEWTPARAGLALDLLEHEVQHQGQLIRYLYALRLEIPASWKRRWALE
jgi:hypothetical protein